MIQSTKVFVIQSACVIRIFKIACLDYEVFKDFQENIEEERFIVYLDKA